MKSEQITIGSVKVEGYEDRSVILEYKGTGKTYITTERRLKKYFEEALLKLIVDIEDGNA